MKNKLKHKLLAIWGRRAAEHSARPDLITGNQALMTPVEPDRLAGTNESNGHTS